MPADLVQGPAGAFLQKLGFIIVHRDPVRLFDETLQVLTIEHRHALTGIEDKRNPRGLELRGVFDHALPTVWRNDPNRHALGIGDLVTRRVFHRAGMEGRDLVIREIGRDEGLCGQRSQRHFHMRALDTALVHPIGIGREINAHGAHGNGLAAEDL